VISNLDSTDPGGLALRVKRRLAIARVTLLIRHWRFDIKPANLSARQYPGCGGVDTATANVNPAAFTSYRDGRNQRSDEQQAKLNVVRRSVARVPVDDRFKGKRTQRSRTIRWAKVRRRVEHHAQQARMLARSCIYSRWN
jgi:hypothetical protein